MKLIISKNELNNQINKALNCVSQRATVPVLSNFLLEATAAGLVVTATDLTVGIRCFTEAKVLQQGSTTVPAKKFASLIKELTANHIEITVLPNEVMEIKADSSTFKLHGMHRNDYPALPDLGGAMQIKMKQSDLKEMFYRTSFAVSREENRYVLTGVYMRVRDGIATFIGTDGRRLARANIAVEVSPAFSGEYILPLKAVEELVKSLDDKEGAECTLFLMPDKVAVEGNQVTLITRLLAGEYPDVSRVIPENSDRILTLHREELITLLRQVSLFLSDPAHAVRFVFNEGELKVAANSSDIGEGQVSMPVNYRGPKMEIAFNPGFFLDILRHSRQETVAMGLIDAFNPGVITDSEEAPSAARTLFVLMPMRLSED